MGGGSNSMNGPAQQTEANAIQTAGQSENIGNSLWNNLGAGSMYPLIFGITPTSSDFNWDYNGNIPGQGQAAVAQSGSPWGATGSAFGAGTGANGSSGSSFSNYGAPGAIMSQAFDPQQSLYNLTRSQTLDATNSALAASGLTGSPLAAAAVGNTMGDFGINWQNNLLGREESGLSSAMGAYTGGMGAGQTAAGPIGTAGNILNQTASTQQAAQTAQAAQQQQASQFGITQGTNALGGLMGKS